MRAAAALASILPPGNVDNFQENLPQIRVARWFIFEPKIRIWVTLKGLRLENVDIFYDHFQYFIAIWDIL
jgi:hypothetical protein